MKPILIKASKFLWALLWLIPSAIFLIAGIIKVADPVTSFEAINAYGIIHGRLVEVAVWGIISVELVLGSSLLIPALRRTAALWALALMIGFIGGRLLAEAKGIQPRCGCFGNWGAPESLWTFLVRDLALIGVLIALLLNEAQATRAVKSRILLRPLSR